jgi:hypothetical protein
VHGSTSAKSRSFSANLSRNVYQYEWLTRVRWWQQRGCGSPSYLRPIASGG